jgi:hypothetical protein
MHDARDEMRAVATVTLRSADVVTLGGTPRLVSMLKESRRRGLREARLDLEDRRCEPNGFIATIRYRCTHDRASGRVFEPYRNRQAIAGHCGFMRIELERAYAAGRVEVAEFDSG